MCIRDRCSGISLPLFNTSNTVLIQENVKKEMLGRVFANLNILSTISTTIGTVSYTHLDVYKRQIFTLFLFMFSVLYCSSERIVIYFVPVNGGRNYNGPKVAKFLLR